MPSLLVHSTFSISSLSSTADALSAECPPDPSGKDVPEEGTRTGSSGSVGSICTGASSGFGTAGTLRIIDNPDAHSLKNTPQSTVVIGLTIGILITPKQVVEETSNSRIGVVPRPTRIKGGIAVDSDRVRLNLIGPEEIRIPSLEDIAFSGRYILIQVDDGALLVTDGLVSGSAIGDESQPVSPAGCFGI